MLAGLSLALIRNGKAMFDSAVKTIQTVANDHNIRKQVEHALVHAAHHVIEWCREKLNHRKHT
ncbi:MAG: hypothetical protein U0793_12705 [Gemmataceae bacterium]